MNYIAGGLSTQMGISIKLGENKAIWRKNTWLEQSGMGTISASTMSWKFAAEPIKKSKYPGLKKQNPQKSPLSNPPFLSH